MMMMDPTFALNNTLTSFNAFSFNSPSDPDVDWSVFENADRYLLRDDSAWITRLSKDFWWNLERISEMSTTEFHRVQQTDANRSQVGAKHLPHQSVFPSSSSIPLNCSSTRKIVGQRSATTHRPAAGNIPEKSNFFPNFSSISDQDMEYDPFHSKISFDNHLWTNLSQQAAIPWQ